MSDELGFAPAEPTVLSGRKFIDRLHLFASLPMKMQHDIVHELDKMDDATQATVRFADLVQKYVAIFTSNA